MGRSLYRIKALLWHEFFLTRRSLEMFFDILFFPMMNVVLFGLIMSYLGGSTGSSSAAYLMLGILLWEIIVINQYNVTVSSMWSVWSHNLTNIFLSPLSVSEYLTAHIVAALIRTVGVVLFLSIGTFLVFGFRLWDVGALNLVLFGLNLSLFAWWIGVILLGLIFRFGTRIQSISWGTIFLFQPLTAAFYPVSVLPAALQVVAYALPATYVFEAARAALHHPVVDWRSAGIAFALNIAYSILALWIFRRLYRGSRMSGQFARNDLG